MASYYDNYPPSASAAAPVPAPTGRRILLGGQWIDVWRGEKGGEFIWRTHTATGRPYRSYSWPGHASVSVVHTPLGQRPVPGIESPAQTAVALDQARGAARLGQACRTYTGAAPCQVRPECVWRQGRLIRGGAGVPSRGPPSCSARPGALQGFAFTFEVDPVTRAIHNVKRNPHDPATVLSSTPTSPTFTAAAASI